jgi:hypothetical protein
MKVLELNSIHREESGLYYRRKFTAEAKLDLLSNTVLTSIAFSIETGPLGNKDIDVELPPHIDLNYPVVPITTALKKFILGMDTEGSLP